MEYIKSLEVEFSILFRTIYLPVVACFFIQGKNRVPEYLTFIIQCRSQFCTEQLTYLWALSPRESTDTCQLFGTKM